MSFSYSGVAGNVTEGQAPSVTLPSDGDALTSASASVSIKLLTDFIALLQSKGVYTDSAQSLTATWTHTGAETHTGTETFNGGASDANGALVTSAVATNFKLVWTLGGAAAKIRIYYGSAAVLVITVNAAWNGTNWVPDATGQADRYQFSNVGTFVHFSLVGLTAATPFSDATWTAASSSAYQFTQQWTGTGNSTTLDNSGITAPGQTTASGFLNATATAAGQAFCAGWTYRKKFPAAPSSCTFTNDFAATNLSGLGITNFLNPNGGNASANSVAAGTVAFGITVTTS